MKRNVIFGLMTLSLACLSLKAVALELDGVRYAGYTTNAVPAGYSILAVPFSGFNTNSFASTNLSLESLLSTNGLVNGDKLVVFDEAATNYYYYALTAAGWDPLDVTELGGDSTNHVVNAPALSTITKAQGYAFWLKAGSARTAQLQGIVNTNAAGVVLTTNTLTLVGNALPTALDLNSTAFTNANPWFLSYSPETGPGDEILVVSGTNYIRNVFIEGTWKKASDYTTSATIPAGSGLWFLRRGDTQTLIVK
jgi:hypothetical protein